VGSGYNWRMQRPVMRRLDGLFALLNMHRTARLFFSLMLDRRVPWTFKLYAWSGLIYIFSPLDVIPDFFTGIGLLDDIILGLVIIQAFLEITPPKVVEEHCQRLGIQPRQVFIDVPETVRQAIELYEWAIGPRYRAAPFAPAGPAAPAPGPSAPPAEPAPPRSRYSAFTEDKA